jgi:hypothetical protein
VLANQRLQRSASCWRDVGVDRQLNLGVVVTVTAIATGLRQDPNGAGSRDLNIPLLEQHSIATRTLARHEVCQRFYWLSN